ncbi:MAG: hypothetical protein ACFFBP_15205 [Promethearchaeota archaeon]
MQKSKIEAPEIIEKHYFKTFKAKDGNFYGIRLAQPYCSDALFVKDIFKDIYGWNYLYPIVYDREQLNNSFIKKSDLWFIGEDIHSKVGVGIGLIERHNRYSLEMGKLCVKNEFHGIGLSTVLGGHMINYLINIPESKSLIRFNCDVRANVLFSQKFVEKTRAKPYGFIANYNNYTDKRINNVSKGEPIVDGELGSVVMYAIYLRKLWKIRRKNLILFDNEDILYHYHIMRALNRQMKKDNITLEKKDELNQESFTISKDYYKAIIKIEGYLRENTLKKLLKKYSNWNVIEWRIPANHQGLNSQKSALDNDFIVSGYDPGSLYLQQLEDGILFCKYPRGIDYSQFEYIDLTPRNKLIVDKILSDIKGKKIKNIHQSKLSW